MPHHCVQVVVSTPIIPLGYQQTHGTYCDPAAAGLWSDVPPKLPPSELFAPVGRPSSPPPCGAVAAAQPVTQSRDGDDQRGLQRCIAGSGVPASGCFSRH